MNVKDNHVECPAYEKIYEKITGRCLDSGLLCGCYGNGDYRNCERRARCITEISKLEARTQSLNI